MSLVPMCHLNGIVYGTGLWLHLQFSPWCLQAGLGMSLSETLERLPVFVDGPDNCSN